MGCVTYITRDGPDQPQQTMAFTGDVVLIRGFIDIIIISCFWITLFIFSTKLYWDLILYVSSFNEIVNMNFFCKFVTIVDGYAVSINNCCTVIICLFIYERADSWLCDYMLSYDYMFFFVCILEILILDHQCAYDVCQYMWLEWKFLYLIINVSTTLASGSVAPAISLTRHWTI